MEEKVIDLRYPIGKAKDQPFSDKENFDENARTFYLADIEMLPSLLENSVLNLDEHQLESAYRPDGWTIKQLIHHVADSHMNAYMRFKVGLTEDNPTIKTYEEAEWAKLSDTKNLPINISLTLLHALHSRWHEILLNMEKGDWERTIYHPEHKRSITLWELLGMYSWHGKHHTAHITSLRERMGW
jgi:hypothetical protein